MLDAINVHGESHAIFWIYPEYRTGRVRCVIPKGIEEKAVAAIGRPVRVDGELRFKAGAQFPHEVMATDLEPIGREELPRLVDLRGRAPKATGDLSAYDFVEALRDEWE